MSTSQTTRYALVPCEQEAVLKLICLCFFPTDSVQGIQRDTQTPYDTSCHGWTVTRTNTGLVFLLFSQAFCRSSLQAHKRVKTEVSFVRSKTLCPRETLQVNRADNCHSTDHVKTTEVV